MNNNEYHFWDEQWNIRLKDPIREAYIIYIDTDGNELYREKL